MMLSLGHLYRRLPFVLMLAVSWLSLLKPCSSLSIDPFRPTTPKSPNRRWRRRDWIRGALGGFSVILMDSSTLATTNPSAWGAETVGKEEDCNDSTCLGVWDGLLADCPHNRLAGGGPGCVSSQDDTPGIFAEPWDYADAPNNSLDWQDQMRLLIPAIQLTSRQRGDGVDILQQEGRYLRVRFVDAKTLEESLGEFYFTPDDTTVQFRLAASSSATSTTTALGGSLRNMDRAERIRQRLGYAKLIVLRNRKRTLFFGESRFDTFGPGSAALGPPADMKTGDLEGRQDVDPRLKIDATQLFPFAKS